MRKMLAIIAGMALSGTAYALPDRSSLSYDENTTINIACASANAQGAGAFQACVAQQLAALAEHPTPDRSGLSPAQARAVAKRCWPVKREGIARYNDCLKAAIAAPPGETDRPSDELVTNYGKIFTAEDDSAPRPTPVALASLPQPGALLPKRPDRIADKPLSAAELYNKVERSVYVVIATQSLAEARSRSYMQGSAVAISEHLLLTNCHVVRDRPLIKLVQETTRATAKLVAADNTTDRCVLETELALAPIAGVRPLESLAIGERVFAVGTPASLERTLSEGLISGIRHEKSRNLVQTSAPISPGSSGGGLFDERGNLIGITTLGSIGFQNLNFAIAATDFWK
jgi:S1-C subfamily serine protease